jgi:hypothetical protein
MKRITKRITFLLTVILFVAGALLSSCSVRQEIYLENDGSGVTLVGIDLSEMLVEYFTELMELGTGGRQAPVFDLGKMRATFADIPDISLVEANTMDRGKLATMIQYQDIQSIFHEHVGESVREAASFEKQNKRYTLQLYLDRANYGAIVDRMIQLASLEEQRDYISGLLQPGDEETILGIYEYAFAEYTGEKTVREIIEQSEVVVDVYVRGEIVEHSGGEPIPGKNEYQQGLRYTIPLLEILTLEEPLTYSLVFR